MDCILLLLFITSFSMKFVSSTDDAACYFTQHMTDVKENCYSIHDSTIKPDDGTTDMPDICMVNKILDIDDQDTVWKGPFDNISIFMIPRKEFKSVEILFPSKKVHQFDSLRIHNSRYSHVEEKGKFYRAYPFSKSGIYLLRVSSSRKTLSIQRIINSMDNSSIFFTVSNERKDQLSVACHTSTQNDEDNSSTAVKIRAEGRSSWLAFNDKKCEDVFMADKNPSLFCEYEMQMLKSFLESESNRTMEFESINTMDDGGRNLTTLEEGEKSQAVQKGNSFLPILIILCVIVIVIIGVCCVRKILKKCAEKDYATQPNTYEAESSLHITEGHFHPNGGFENETIDTEETDLDKLTADNTCDNDGKTKIAAQLSTIEEQTSEKDSLKLPTDQQPLDDIESMDEISLKTKSPRNSSTNNLLSDDQLSNDFDGKVQKQEIDTRNPTV